MAEVLRPEPYVGVSGIATYEQHIALFDVALREHINALGRFVMIGIQATGKTQVHGIENRRGQMWHPVGDSIADAATKDESGLTRPYIHCFFENDEELTVGVDNIMRRTSHYIKGLQLNGLPWTEKDYRPFVNDFKQKHPDQSIILQANGDVIRSNTPKQLADELSTMPVDYLLLDTSGGYGVAYDRQQMKNYVDEIYQRQLPVGVVVAGGLEAQNIEDMLGPLLEVYPDISCDAEGRLRKGPEGKTELDLAAAEAFIVAWKNILPNKKTA